jgi:cell division protein FtsN
VVDTAPPEPAVRIVPSTASVPDGQNAVRVTERPAAPRVLTREPERPDTILPTITPAPETDLPAAMPESETPAPDPPAVTEPAPEAPLADPEAATTEAPPPISLAPPPPASLRAPVVAPAEPATRYFRVQVGRFSSRTDADALKTELGKEGYTPTVVVVRRENRDEYRVQVNTFRLRENATRTIEDLKAKQYAPYLAEESP